MKPRHEYSERDWKYLSIIWVSGFFIEFERFIAKPNYSIIPKVLPIDHLPIIATQDNGPADDHNNQSSLQK